MGVISHRTDFQPSKNIRNTARKALKSLRLNAQHSEVSKMVSHVLLARLDPAQKLSQNYEKFAFLTQND